MYRLLTGLTSYQESTKLCLVNRCWNVCLTGLVDWAGGDLSRKGKRTWFESPQKMTVRNLWSLTTWKRGERKAVGRLFGA